MGTVPSSALWTSGRFAVVDVEGNGRQPPDPVELAVVVIDGGAEPSARSWLLKPAQSISSRAVRIHGITNAEVAGAPRFEEIAPEVETAVKGRYFVAHNASVDWGVVRQRLPDVRPLAVLDTLRLAWKVIPGQESYSLPKLIGALGLGAELATVEGGPHRALYDAMAALALLRYLANRCGEGPMGLSELVALCQVAVGSGGEQQSLF